MTTTSLNSQQLAGEIFEQAIIRTQNYLWGVKKVDETHVKVWRRNMDGEHCEMAWSIGPPEIGNIWTLKPLNITGISTDVDRELEAFADYLRSGSFALPFLSLGTPGDPPTSDDE